MKLTYRGVSYEYTPPAVETVPGVAMGKYRGLDFRFRNTKKPPVMIPHHNLTYRGVKYNTQSNHGSVSPVAEKARVLAMASDRAQEKRGESMLGRLAAELGLAH
jgi:hypothetical protein